MKSVTVLGLVVLLVVAGCSSDGGDDEAPRPLPSADQQTELTVVVSDGEGNDETFTVTCDPADGTHPRPESACEFLELAAKWGEDPFAPVPEDAVCTQIYGGPETATVTGVWLGREIDATFSRENGCEIDRWNNAVALLALAGEQDSGGIQP
jgi:hypothetical protein